MPWVNDDDERVRNRMAVVKDFLAAVIIYHRFIDDDWCCSKCATIL